MTEFTLGDLTLTEIALTQFFKEIDLSLQVAQQVQELIGKIEIQMGKLKAAALEQGSPKLTEVDPLKVKA